MFYLISGGDFDICLILKSFLSIPPFTPKSFLNKIWQHQNYFLGLDASNLIENLKPASVPPISMDLSISINDFSQTNHQEGFSGKKYSHESKCLCPNFYFSLRRNSKLLRNFRTFLLAVITVDSNTSLHYFLSHDCNYFSFPFASIDRH